MTALEKKVYKWLKDRSLGIQEENLKRYFTEKGEPIPNEKDMDALVYKLGRIIYRSCLPKHARIDYD